MTPRLNDLSQALTYAITREIQAAPPQYRGNAETLARLESADYQEQLLTCETDTQREALSQRWLRAFNPQ